MRNTRLPTWQAGLQFTLHNSIHTPWHFKYPSVLRSSVRKKWNKSRKRCIFECFDIRWGALSATQKRELSGQDRDYNCSNDHKGRIA
jgi:hypothetical protein